MPNSALATLHILEWERQRKLRFTETMLIIAALKDSDNITKLYERYRELSFPELESKTQDFVKTADRLMKKYKDVVFAANIENNVITIKKQSKTKSQEKTDEHSISS